MDDNDKLKELQERTETELTLASASMQWAILDVIRAICEDGDIKLCERWHDTLKVCIEQLDEKLEDLGKDGGNKQ